MILKKSKERKEKIILTFHTTSDAMMMEKVCKELEIEGRLIPIPRKISASCGLAWCSDIELKETLIEVVKNKKIDIDGQYEILR